MKKAVILGAGLATRLYPITHHIPKVLVNYKQHTILKNLHDIYRDLGADEIIVVVHSKFHEMVEAYAEQEGLKIKIQTVDESYGSAYALALLDPILHGHNVIVNWCDIIPDFGSWCWEQNTIYTKGGECRFDFDGERIRNVGKTGGNVVGIYQLADWEFFMGDTKEEINEYCNGQDFVEFLYGPAFKQSELMNLIDLGDMEKLAKAHSNRELNRSFNSVEIGKDTVIKYAVTEQGRALQLDEIEWYKKVQIPSVPQVVAIHPETHGFEMERIHGIPMFDYMLSKDTDKASNVVNDILEGLKFSDKRVCKDFKEVMDDFKKEFYDKVLDRCELIQDVIDSFGDIKYVNGVKLGRLRPMLKQALAHLLHYQAGKGYYVIHGDPNFSNTMATYEGEVKFIDPRGYFGNTKIYGPRLYDEAKVLYAISGYDEFNSDALWGQFDVDGEQSNVCINPLIRDYKNLPQFNEYHHLAVAVIWIALGGYFKNNPLKAVASYYHGMKLLTQQLNKMGRRLLDGTCSPNVDEPVTATLITKNPGKWVLLDKETGVKYTPIGGDITHQWERINETDF